MAIITQSVGTAARTFSTPQAWEDALPANAVTAGNSYVGELYNDSEFVSAGVVLTMAGTTTDTSHTITVKAATGQSWSDNLAAQTNAVTYNVSNGVGIRSTGFYNPTVTSSVLNTFWIGLQFQGSSNQRIFDNNINGVVTDQNMTSCIVERAPSGGTSAPPLRFRSGLCTNTFVIQRDSGNGVDCDYAGTGLRFVNLTVVRPSDKTVGGSGFASSSNAPLVENCAVFGFTNFSSGTFSGSNNCSDVAIGFGTSNQASKIYINQFVSTVDATRDFKAKAAADLLDHAVTDTTNIPSATDAVGTARPQGTAWDIGAWELKAGGTSASLTGVLATGSPGSFGLSISRNTTLTGVQAAGGVGSFTPSEQVTLSGVSATGSPGSFTVTGAASPALAGVSATGSPGLFSTSSTASPTLVGVEATGSPGSFSATISPNATLTGVQATGAAGTIVVSSGSNVSQPLTGVGATGSPGSFTVTGAASPALAGVSATGSPGSLSPSTSKSTTLSGVSATGSVSSFTPNNRATLAGVSAIGSPGSFGFNIDSSITLLGVQAAGFAGTITVGGNGVGPCTMLLNDFSFYTMATNDVATWGMQLGEIS